MASMVLAAPRHEQVFGYFIISLEASPYDYFHGIKRLSGVIFNSYAY